MRDRPEEVTERELRLALADGWGIRAESLEYRPVGGGSYHWVAAGSWFVTVDDLDQKAWLGRRRPAVLAGLRTAMDTAAALRGDAALGFVVPPVPARDGRTVHPLGARYAVAVFPFLDGTTGRFGDPGSPRERAELVHMLAALHRSTPAVRRPPRAWIDLARRGDLDAALRELDQPWPGAPFAEPARALLAGTAGPIRRLLETFDRQAADVAARDPVITHGEPHPGNLIRVGAETMLVDWDTVGLAPPERDLWWVATETCDETCRYTDLTGRPVDPGMLAFYRLRWALDDISCFVHDLRARHVRRPGTPDSPDRPGTPDSLDAEHAWQALQITIAQLTR